MTATKQLVPVEKSYLPIPGARWTKNLGVLSFSRVDKEEGRWEYLEVSDQPTILVLGLTLEGKIIATNIQRFPVNAFCTEIPGGMPNKGESPEETAKREFIEETGYEAEKVSFLCRGFLWNGKSNASFEIWYGENCKKVSDVKLDPVEETAQLTVEEFFVEEIGDMLLSGSSAIDPVLSQGILTLLVKGEIAL